MKHNQVKKLENILENHNKLISMISGNILPIKQILIDDVKTMKQILDSGQMKQIKEENT
jgi:hypothetical protein